MGKCEAHYLAQANGDDYEYKRLIMDNCPCHVNCYRKVGQIFQLLKFFENLMNCNKKRVR